MLKKGYIVVPGGLAVFKSQLVTLSIKEVFVGQLIVKEEECNIYRQGAQWQIHIPFLTNSAMEEEAGQAAFLAPILLNDSYQRPM